MISLYFSICYANQYINLIMNDVKTFHHLLVFLKTLPCDKLEFTRFLEADGNAQESGYRQEAVLKLFAPCGLIESLKEFVPADGNFSMGTCQPTTNKKSLFFNNKNKPFDIRGNGGDASDYTAFSKDNETIIATTSKSHKNDKTETVKSLELDEISNKASQHYPNKNLNMCICVRDRIHVNNMNPQECNADLRPYLKTAIIVDWANLFDAFVLFKTVYVDMQFDDVLGINSNLPIFTPRFYQKFASKKFLSMINTVDAVAVTALLAYLPRTGKTSVIINTIIEDNRQEDSYLIITPCPNETISGYFELLQCVQLRDYNIQHLSGDNLHPTVGTRNVFIVSKQFLQNKLDEGKHLECLLQSKIRIVFVDEAHLGCTTDIMKKIFEFYTPTAHRLFVTATYGKPASVFNIPVTRQFNWDLEDIMLCKYIDKPGNREKLIRKYGAEFSEIMNEYTDDRIKNEIGCFPELQYLTHKIKNDVYDEASDATVGTKYGWSSDSIFNGNWNLRKLTENDIPTFQNEDAVLATMYSIFGKRSSLGIPDKEYPEKSVFMDRAKLICRRNGQKELCTDSTNPSVVLAFLPPNNINFTSVALKMLIEKHNILPDYHIIITNTAASSQDAKTRVMDAVTRAKNTDKKGVLVLTGTQLHLGVTINECDLALLLNSSTSFDKVFQMIFRCMTPRHGKKFGFVVDLNLQRAITTTLSQYARTVRPGTSMKESLRYLIENRLLSLNADHWLPSFGNAQNALVDMCSDAYRLFIKNCNFAIKNQLQTLLDTKFELSADEQKQLTMFKNGMVSRDNTIQTTVLNENDQHLQTGLDRTALVTNNNNVDEEDISNVDEVNDDDEDDSRKNLSIEEIMYHLTPLLCLFTIHEKCDTIQGMYDLVEETQSLKNCMMSQVNLWWGNDNNHIALEQVKEIVSLYIIKMNDTTNEIVANIKQLFLEYKHNTTELSHLIDVYFVPKEIEKSRNAEISTPLSIRRYMLNRIDETFWQNSHHKVIEPCAGKGQFVVDIIDRFMNGLKDVFPDEKVRYKHVVENCVYFADINPTNIFICTLLLDPDNQYKLNYYTGDTLSMNMFETWNIERFHLCVMNPPYNEDPENSADPHKKPLYQNWIQYYNCISQQLLVISPSKWFTSDDKPLKLLREYMQQQAVISMQHFPNDDVFPGVSIKGGVSYFHIDNRVLDMDDNFRTNFNGTNIRLSDFEIILSDPTFASLVNHMKPYFSEKALSSEYVTQGRYVDSDKLLSKERNDDTDVVCYVSKQKGMKQYCPLGSINNNAKFDSWKVITTAAAHNGSSGFGNIFIGKPGEIHSKSYVSFNVTSESQAKNLESFLKCKLPQIMLSLRKITHNLTNTNVFAWIPYPPVDREWTNKSVCEFYGLSEELVQLVKAHTMEGNYYNDF